MKPSAFTLPLYQMFTHNAGDPDDCHCNECFGLTLVKIMDDNEMTLRQLAKAIDVPVLAIVDFIWGPKTPDGLPFCSN